jgi:hypothetical protein
MNDCLKHINAKNATKTRKDAGSSEYSKNVAVKSRTEILKL